MSLIERVTRSPGDRRQAVGDDRFLGQDTKLVPPDWVFLTAWPLLKLGALRSDVGVARSPRGRRGALVALRAVDWAAFIAFPRVAPRSGSATVVAALTFVQAAATGEVMRRSRDLDPAISRSLAPQLAWLCYATAVPLLLARQPA